MKNVTKIFLLLFSVTANAASWAETYVAPSELDSANHEGSAQQGEVDIGSMWEGFKSLWVEQPYVEGSINAESEREPESGQYSAASKINSRYDGSYEAIESPPATQQDTVLPILADFLSLSSEEGQYKDGVKHGTWTERYSDGQKKSEIEYKDGVKHGISKYWYKNGQVKKVVHYVDGRKEGKEMWWHDNGQKLYETGYRSGNQYGKTTWWYDDGTVQSVSYYGGAREHVEGSGLGKIWNNFTALWSDDGLKKENHQAIQETAPAGVSEQTADKIEEASSDNVKEENNDQSSGDGDVVNQNWLWGGNKKQYRGF